MIELRTAMRVGVIAASLGALAIARASTDADGAGEEIPALGALPALKLRIFYAGLLVAATASVVPGSGAAPLYLVLVLLFAGLPTLGHQTIGLTLARRRSPAAHRLWLLGVVYPVLLLLLGATLVPAHAA